MIAETVQPQLLLARRMSRLGTETAFEVLSKAKALERQGKSIIHLEIGEPDFDTPANVVEAAVDALRKGWTHYGPSAGLPELRESIAQYVSHTREIEVSSPMKSSWCRAASPSSSSPCWR
jgi:aspartate aminotransferase